MLTETRGNKRLRHRLIPRRYQLAGLHGQRQPVDDVTGTVLGVFHVTEFLFKGIDGLVQSRIATPGLAQFGKPGLQHRRSLGQGAQHVQRLHITRALPDRIDRRLAVKPRHDEVFGDPVATETLHGFVGMEGSAFTDPVFARRQAKAQQQLFVFVFRVQGGLVQRLPHTHGNRQRAFHFQLQVRQHITHQRLVQQGLAERRPTGSMVHRLSHCLTLASHGADHAVEAGHGHHFNDGRHAAAFLAHHPAQRAAQFDLGRGVGHVTHLVFQALYLDRILAAIRAPARHQKTAQAILGLCQHQEGITHGSGGEPLVAH